MKAEDYEAWLCVEKEISETARRLCGEFCMDNINKENKEPCKGCGAANDRSWRRDALILMKKEAGE